MTQTHSTTKKQSYTHLTEIERGQIAAYIQEGLSYREIGRRLGRNVSTISREIERGTVMQIDTFRKPYQKYFHDIGPRVYEENRLHYAAHSTGMEARGLVEFAEAIRKGEDWSLDAVVGYTTVMEAWGFVEFEEDKIKGEDWSPDPVVGYAKRHELFDYIPTSKALYNWIDDGKLKVINLDLPLKLSRTTKKRKARKHKKVLGTSIEERPESVETREEFGHWEIDTVLGHKSNDDALLTLVERKSRHKIVKRIDSQTVSAVSKTLN